jgi:thiol-disulfide isomerase/thioredoxin
MCFPSFAPWWYVLLPICREITLERLINQRSLQSKSYEGALVSVAQAVVTQTLAPIYEQLADSYSHAKDKVVVAKVDADGAGKPLGQKYGVTGFPSA